MKAVCIVSFFCASVDCDATVIFSVFLNCLVHIAELSCGLSGCSTQLNLRPFSPFTVPGST